MIYPSLIHSLQGMMKDDEHLETYLENYTQRIEQLAINTSSHAREFFEATDFIIKNKLLFPQEIDYAVLLSAIEEITEETIDYSSFEEPELPNEITGGSEEE